MILSGRYSGRDLEIIVTRRSYSRSIIREKDVVPSGNNPTARVSTVYESTRVPILVDLLEESADYTMRID